MKVLLFVQTGDARPKYLGAQVRVVKSYVQRVEGDEMRTGWSCTPRQHAAMHAPGARWFRVECKNADTGREIIRCDDRFGAAVAQAMFDGRILARGGRP